MKYAFVILAGLFFFGTFSGTLHADIIISDGWVKNTIGGVRNTAAFMTLTNTGNEDVNIVAAQSSVAKVTQIHLMKHEKGMMHMRPVNRVTVPANGQVILEARGLHIMMMGLKEDLMVDQKVTIELQLGDGKKVQEMLKVRALGS